LPFASVLLGLWRGAIRPGVTRLILVGVFCCFVDEHASAEQVCPIALDTYSKCNGIRQFDAIQQATRDK